MFLILISLLLVSFVFAVDAPIGTDPETLIEQAKAKFVQRILEGDIVVVFENIFYSETGVYDEDWKTYNREVEDE